jgi:hypothetical protein
MDEQTAAKDDSLCAVLGELLESGALVLEEVIETIKPSPADRRRAQRRFWEFQAKLAAGVATFAENRLRDLKNPTTTRHATRIVVEEDK